MFIKSNDIGLGDSIARLLYKIGITPQTWSAYRVCGGFSCVLVKVPDDEICNCDKRREWLNKVFPYTKKG